MVGSIYLAKIYFTDGIKFKLRPILIIKENSFGDYIYIPFTTNSNNINSIKFDNNFLENGSFKKETYLIIDKTCTISPNLLDRKVAHIKKDNLFQVYNIYCNFLKS